MTSVYNETTAKISSPFFDVMIHFVRFALSKCALKYTRNFRAIESLFSFCLFEKKTKKSPKFAFRSSRLNPTLGIALKLRSDFSQRSEALSDAAGNDAATKGKRGGLGRISRCGAVSAPAGKIVSRMRQGDTRQPSHYEAFYFHYKLQLSRRHLLQAIRAAISRPVNPIYVTSAAN